MSCMININRQELSKRLLIPILAGWGAYWHQLQKFTGCWHIRTQNDFNAEKTFIGKVWGKGCSSASGRVRQIFVDMTFEPALTDEHPRHPERQKQRQRPELATPEVEGLWGRKSWKEIDSLYFKLSRCHSLLKQNELFTTCLNSQAKQTYLCSEKLSKE